MAPPSETFDSDFVEDDFFDEWEMRIDSMERVDEDTRFDADDFDSVQEFEAYEVTTVIENDPTGFNEPGTEETDLVVLAMNEGGDWKIWDGA